MTLSLSGLTITVRADGTDRVLVADLSLEVEESRTIAVVGESGSGKSITALSVLGLLTSWYAASAFSVSGLLRIDGEPEYRLDLATARDVDFDAIRGRAVSMIFQDPWTALNPIRTVGRQLVESVRAHSTVTATEARTRAIDLLERVGIQQPAERYDSYPHQLSGGQLQRIMIAMALAGRPRFLIADEPTTALDVTVQRGILQLLDELRADGLGILLITHDLSVVAHHSDRIAVMYGGAIVESGRSRAVIADPRHPYTRLLISSVPTLDVEPGSRLVTKADVLAGRSIDPRLGRFDPEQRTDVELVRIADDHVVSRRFVGGLR
ncbi:ABC transporter ATP-binding protein [Microlunatus parietis]|uniref:ABC-type dipeptide/oligopeptide/nickel transport system ATPase component n=1 Tax=Microlunatus parietis TaxID=682979 RepID=A0A7Y9LFC7_9ACTN|nr:ABC transporter ATP-binding protein [Microlunatus parietis]NYE74713.1 ABC-type dipeptide/oligopeptide/nickel transport system ATPase component [Microlunatus parietis]